MKIKLITIPDVFEGTLDHWQDCFFSFPADMDLGARMLQIVEFCAGKQWPVTIELDLPDKSLIVKDCNCVGLSHRDDCPHWVLPL